MAVPRLGGEGDLEWRRSGTSSTAARRPTAPRSTPSTRGPASRGRRSRWAARRRPTGRSPRRAGRSTRARGRGWASPSAARIIHRFADLLIEHVDDLALADTRDMGKPISDARGKDVPRAAQNFRFFADHARLATAETLPMDTGHHAYTRYEPAGVVAAIAPWNFPLMLESWKVAPALAWGNTVVLKPAEDTPASATIMARLALEAGMPPGVFNVAARLRAELGGLGAHRGPPGRPDHVHRRVEHRAGRSPAPPPRNLTPVSLELGGKGANLVFADADLDNAVELVDQGDLLQRRPGLPRRLAALRRAGGARRVPRPVRRRCRGACVIGDPKDPATELGPLASRDALHEGARLRRHLGRREDPHRRARRRLDREARPSSSTSRPTPRSSARRCSARSSRSPRSTPRTRRSRAANGTPYGLNAMIFTENLSRAHRVGGPAARGHDLDELLLHPRPARPVRRLRRLRLGPRGRQLQPGVLHRAQGRRDGAPHLVSEKHGHSRVFRSRQS